RSDEKLVGGRSVSDHVLLSLQYIAVAVLFGARCDRIELTASLRLLVRNDRYELAGCDLRQQLSRNVRVAELCDQGRREHGSAQIGLQQQSSAECVHDEHRFDGPRAESAMLLGHIDRGQSEACELLPDPAAPSFRGAQELAPILGSVVVVYEALDRVCEKLLVVCEGDMHIGSGLRLAVSGL